MMGSENRIRPVMHAEDLKELSEITEPDELEVRSYEMSAENVERIFYQFHTSMISLEIVSFRYIH